MFCNNLIFYFILLKLFCIDCGYLEDNFPESVIEDCNLDTAQLIKKYKYPQETHFVTTEDDYILQVHRIPKPQAPPVFLMHGLEDSSGTWILMGPRKALGYYLYDNGYDVWMGNARGNRYSRNHTTLDHNTDKAFWKFTWHEIGYYDLPAMIDYILKVTHFKKTGYFGHSQGTTSFFVLTSMRPAYNEKITIMHALAPVAFMNHATKAPYTALAVNFIKASRKRFTEFTPHNDLLYKLCFTSKIMEEFCTDIYYQIVGKDIEQTNSTMMPVILAHTPAGCNFKQFQHYIQSFDSGYFRQYDHGPKENMKRYGSATPPDYPLRKITAPIGLYYTLNDHLASEVDVQRLRKLLPNVVVDSLYPNKKWNHMTVVWGVDARQLVHKRMLEVMRNFSYDV